MSEWIHRHRRDISVFIAGWCALACVTDLAVGNYIWALINGIVCALNITSARM